MTEGRKPRRFVGKVPSLCPEPSPDEVLAATVEDTPDALLRGVRLAPRPVGPGPRGGFVLSNPNGGVSSEDACGNGFWPVDAPSSPITFINGNLREGFHRKWVTDQEFILSESSYMEGRVIGASEIEFDMMIGEITGDTPSTVVSPAFLEIHRRSSTTPSAWAPVLSHEVTFRTEPFFMADGLWQYYTFCRLEGVADYLFRIVPSGVVNRFTFHAVVQYKGFFI